MKKILFCTGSFRTGSGGVASYAHDFIESFNKDFEIIVVNGEAMKAGEFLDFDIRFINCRDFSDDNANMFMSLIIEIKPDVIVNSSFPLLTLVTPYLSEDLKIVTISHFVDGLLMWNAGFNGNYSDNIITLSSYGKDNIIETFGIQDTQKVTTIWNFMPEVKPNFEEKKKREILKIVYPGGSTFNKSSEVVCKALKILLKTNLKFEFYWIGNVNLANGGLSFLRTKTIADCLPKDSRIKHLGRVSREESKIILSEANIFLLPSRGEGFPITLIEAMRNGCIPIVSDAKHGSLDAIKNGANGFVVQQNNAKELVYVISDIILNHNKFFSIYESSCNFYKKFLTESVWHSQMLKVINSDNSHCRRRKKNDIIQYRKDRKIYTCFLKRFNLLVKLRYLYLTLYFRYVRYFV